MTLQDVLTVAAIGLGASLAANGRQTPIQGPDTGHGWLTPGGSGLAPYRLTTTRGLRCGSSPLQDAAQRRHLGKREKGAHGRLGAVTAYPCRIATGWDRASTFLGPIGFDTELMGHRACSRRSFRLDQMSNPNCERQRNRRNRASGVSRRWARSPSISAASSHGLVGSNPASNRRDIAGGGGADPLASTAVEASRPYLDQACGRRWLVGFVDWGSIPRGSTSSSPPWPVNIHGRATSVCWETR